MAGHAVMYESATESVDRTSSRCYCRVVIAMVKWAMNYLPAARSVAAGHHDVTLRGMPMIAGAIAVFKQISASIGGDNIASRLHDEEFRALRRLAR